jgi:hypothetical protein
MADEEQNVTYILNAENRFALFPGIGLTSNGGAYDGSVERYFDVDTSLFLSLSGEQIIEGQKTFAFNPLIGEAKTVLTSGDQTISGLKTFTDRPYVNNTPVVLSGDSAGVATPNDLTFGFGMESSGDFFNGSSAKTIAINPNEIVSITGIEEISGQKTFTLTPKVGSGIIILNTGEQTLSGKLIIENEFIQSGSLSIGGTGSGNYFGASAISNNFGTSGNLNNFGEFSTLNYFGNSSTSNEFGLLSVNKFGESGVNTFYSGVFTGQTFFENNIIIGNGQPVMNTGSEVISGLKTFLNDLTISGDLILGDNNTVVDTQVHTLIGGSGNYSSGNASVVLGGRNNTLNGDYSLIAVGEDNTLSGSRSLILNGILNNITGNDNIILGGTGNKIASGIFSSIVNGYNNTIYDSNSFIGNGNRNIISGADNFIGGGYEHGITGNNNFIGFGYGNLITGADSVIAGGAYNILYGYRGSVLGGFNNQILESTNSSIGGGNINKIQGGENITIAGGSSNEIISGDASFIGGGIINKINSPESVICGGTYNEINAISSIIVGGFENLINTDCSYSFIGGGNNNSIESGSYSLINGGYYNEISGSNSSILGGDQNKIYSDYSNAIGRRVNISSEHLGATVIADGQERDHYSRGAHTLTLDFFNGVYLRLPQFTGSSSQTGNRGELAVSGDYLYICTGTNGSGWARLQLTDNNF